MDNFGFGPTRHEPDSGGEIHKIRGKIQLACSIIDIFNKDIRDQSHKDIQKLKFSWFAFYGERKGSST